MTNREEGNRIGGYEWRFVNLGSGDGTAVGNAPSAQTLRIDFKVSLR